MLLLAGLTTGHKIGLAVVAIVFILFALASSFLAPRRWPDFPGKNGLPVFIIASFALFAAMVAAVQVFGREAKEAKAAPVASTAPAKPGPSGAVTATETEFKIALSTATLAAPGKVTIDVKNAGKIQHDLAVQGPGVSASAKTPLINAGASTMLTVTLAAGKYTLYCTVPGHRAAGMVTTLTVK